MSGLAGKFPPSYMGAVVQGQALGGIFASATNVIIISCGANAVTAAFPDFLVAVFFLISALIAYAFLCRTEFYKYYSAETSETQPKDEENQEEQLIDDGTGDVKVLAEKTTTLQIVKRIWVWILAVFVCFLGTLAVFPAVTVLVESIGKSDKNPSTWSTDYFIPVGCFLLFNVGDYLGRMFAGVVQWPRANHFGSVFILVLSVLRLAFIPLFLFCNAAPKNRSVTDVHIYSDAAYLVFMAIFSLTNGYIGSIAMMFGPKMMGNGQDQGRAAALLVSFLVSGLAVGAAMSGYIVALL